MLVVVAILSPTPSLPLTTLLLVQEGMEGSAHLFPPQMRRGNVENRDNFLFG